MRQDVLQKALDDPRGTAARILDAAERVFAEHGFAAASTREIAALARVPLGAVHYHWGTKQGLREAVMSRLADRIRDTLLRNFVPGATPGGTIDNMVDAFLELLIANHDTARLMYRTPLEPMDDRSLRLFKELETLGLGMARETHPDATIDIPAAILVVSSMFLTAVVDEAAQQIAFGASVFHSRPARERLRAELRRMARAAFQVT
jgi:AcrR family transcriptional regulator